MKQGIESAEKGAGMKLIEEIREEKGLSWREMGKLVGVDHQRLYNLSKGGRNIETFLRLLVNLRRVSGLSKSQFLDRLEKEFL